MSKGPIGYLWWLAFRAAWRLLGAVPFRLTAHGTDTLPGDGPYLLLPNHTGALDPFWVAQPLGRPAHFMASANLFRNRVMGAFIRSLGAFPKEKFTSDRASMRTVQRLYDEGEVVVIFPEGARTWDGRLNPVGEGVGRMVKRLGARVVYCRIRTGHLWQPRWARWPRWVPVVLEYDPPVTYGPEVTAAEITADAVRRMTLPDTLPEVQPVAGWRTAEGLPDYLWACARCGQPGGLVVHGRGRRQLRCECGAAWEVGPLGTLRGVGDVPTLSIAEAHDAMLAHFGSPPVQDPARFGVDGVALSVPMSRFGRLERGSRAPVWVAAGPMTVSSAGLTVAEDGDSWVLPFEDITAILMEMGNTLRVRTANTQYVLEVPGTPTAMVLHFARAWRGVSTRP